MPKEYWRCKQSSKIMEKSTAKENEKWMLPQQRNKFEIGREKRNDTDASYNKLLKNYAAKWELYVDHNKYNNKRRLILPQTKLIRISMMAMVMDTDGEY